MEMGVETYWHLHLGQSWPFWSLHMTEHPGRVRGEKQFQDQVFPWIQTQLDVRRSRSPLAFSMQSKFNMLCTWATHAHQNHLLWFQTSTPAGPTPTVSERRGSTGVMCRLRSQTGPGCKLSPPRLAGGPWRGYHMELCASVSSAAQWRSSRQDA